MSWNDDDKIDLANIINRTLIDAYGLNLDSLFFVAFHMNQRFLVLGPLVSTCAECNF